MKKIFKGLLVSLLLLTSTASLTSCFDEEAMEISTITTVTLENGDIQVIITYTDEDTKPTTFVVPKGDAGEDGTGIQGIQLGEKTELNETLIYIKLTNGQSVPVAIPNGEDGVSITGIEQRFDEETQCTYIKVAFSNGEYSEEYALPKGEPGKDGIDGKDGIGIVEIIPTVNRDYSVTLTIVLTEGEPVEVLIPAPEKGDKGDDGKEISNIESEFDSKNDKYIFTVTYTDESKTIFDVSRQNKWFTEDRSPLPTDGMNGDIWYDVTNQVISIKENNQWKEAINFDILQSKTYDIRFELNDSKAEPGKMPNTILNYEIYEDFEEGCSFASERITVPVPTRDGYIFIGWYATKDKLNPTHGAFTDMTPIMSDMTLYARWEKIETTQEPSEENTEIPSEEETENN